MELEGVEVPDHFNAKSRCTPSWSSVKKDLEEDFEKLNQRLQGLVPAADAGRKERELGAGMDWEKVRRAYRKIIDEAGGGIEEEQARALKERFRGFAILPVDKYNAEMAIV